MPKEIYKILGQNRPATSTEENVYTVPQKRSAIVKIGIFNSDGSAAAVSVSIVPDGGAASPPTTSPENFLLEGYSLGANLPAELGILKGITMNEFDQIRVESDNAVTNFHVYGVEIEP